MLWVISCKTTRTSGIAESQDWKTMKSTLINREQIINDNFKDDFKNILLKIVLENTKKKKEKERKDRKDDDKAMCLIKIVISTMQTSSIIACIRQRIFSFFFRI